MRALGKTDIGKCSQRRLVQAGLGRGATEDAVARAGARLHGEGDVLERGEAWKDRAHLEGSRQAECGAGMYGQARYVASVELDCSRVRSDQPGNLVDQRRL